MVVIAVAKVFKGGSSTDPYDFLEDKILLQYLQKKLFKTSLLTSLIFVENQLNLRFYSF